MTCLDRAEVGIRVSVLGEVVGALGNLDLFGLIIVSVHLNLN